jgi:hypothetical protein
MKNCVNRRFSKTMSSEHDLDANTSQLGDGVSDDPPQQDNPTPVEYVRTVLRSARRAEGDPFMLA